MTPAELKKQITSGTLMQMHFTKDELRKFRRIPITDFLRWFNSSTISGSSDAYRIKSRCPIIIDKNIAKAVGKPKLFTAEFQNPCTAIDFCRQYLGLSFYQAAYALYTYLNTDNVNVETIAKNGKFDDSFDLPF